MTFLERNTCAMKTKMPQCVRYRNRVRSRHIASSVQMNMCFWMCARCWIEILFRVRLLFAFSSWAFLWLFWSQQETIFLQVYLSSLIYFLFHFLCLVFIAKCLEIYIYKYCILIICFLYFISFVLLPDAVTFSVSLCVMWVQTAIEKRPEPDMEKIYQQFSCGYCVLSFNVFVDNSEVVFVFGFLWYTSNKYWWCSDRTNDRFNQSSSRFFSCTHNS